jgi:predicted metal-binding membrane protein
MARWQRWRGPRGSIEHPESALNLRLALALFGLVCCAAGAMLAVLAGQGTFAWVLGGLAAIALVDIVVIQTRRRARARRDGAGHSLFE